MNEMELVLWESVNDTVEMAIGAIGAAEGEDDRVREMSKAESKWRW
jgi:hypothetical protein